MKISKACYQTVFSNDEKNIYNVGGTVCKLIVKEKPQEVYRISSLKYPSEIVLSDDEKMLAIFSTEGYIAVHNAANGKLIASTKALKQEGQGIYFLEGISKIICSTWDGNIIIFDYTTLQLEVICFEKIRGRCLMKTQKKNKFLLRKNMMIIMFQK